MRARSCFDRLLALRCGGLAAVALVSLLGGCAERSGTTRSAPSVNLSGYSAGFREGFGDGCESARGVMRRNQKRNSEDPQYAQGWADGYTMCGKR